MDTSNLTPGQAAILDGIFEAPQEAPDAQQPKAPAASLKELGDRELADLINRLLQEQQERAVEAADPEALTTDAFNQMFQRKGDAIEPEIVAGILVCAGSLRHLSSTSHECSFVHIDEHWCWEHPDALSDDVRKIPNNGREHQRSVTLVPITEGSQVDFVTCKLTPRDGHKAQKSISYTVVNGQLEVTNTRSAPKPSGGR